MAKSTNQIQNEIAANEALIEELSKLQENITRKKPTNKFQEEGYSALPITEQQQDNTIMSIKVLKVKIHSYQTHHINSKLVLLH